MTANHLHKQAGHHHIFFTQPDPFTFGPPEFPWRIPVYTLPDFCLEDHDMPLTRDDEPEHKAIWDMPSHPCNYFRSELTHALPERWNMTIVDLAGASEHTHWHS
jgi:hypothetical protein